MPELFDLQEDISTW